MDMRINCRVFKQLWVLAAFAMIVVMNFSGSGFCANWSWDQNHDCVKGEGGISGWGKWGYDGTMHGEYTTKECCELYCKACPVYANTGRYQKTFTDLSVPGIGPALNITRTYNSQEWSSSLLGYSWTFNFGRKLIITRNKDGEKIIGVLLSQGEKNYYREDLDGTLTRLTEYGATYDLIKKPDNTYAIFNKNGSRYELREDGKIDKIIDRNQNELVFSYNSVGCLSRITNASGNYIDFQLGPNGKIASISDNLGRTVTYGYDDNGNLISATNPLGHSTQYVYNSKNFLTQIIDARGNVVETASYDDNQPPRVSSFTEKGETYTIAYFDGRTEKTDSAGNKWTYYFNDVGVIEKVVDPFGNVKQQQLNKITSTSVDWEEDLNGNRTTFKYDTEGNIISKTDPKGNTWIYSYIAGTDMVESETNPLGVVTKLIYDAHKNMTAIIRDYGGALENTTTYTYDTNGNRTGETDPDGHTTTYKYDSNGLLIKKTNPLGSTITFTYDDWGNRITETDPAGNTKELSYNAIGNLLAETNKLGQTTRYQYDAGGNLVKKVLPSGAHEIMIYDLYDRVVKHLNAEGESTLYNYSPTKDSISTPDGRLTIYYKDVLGHITKMVTKIGDRDPDTVDNDDIVQNYEYDANGNLLNVKTAAGEVLVEYSYDKNGRLVKYKNVGEPIIENEYDANGNHIRTNLGQNSYIYTYNALNVLTKVEDDFGVIFTAEHDANGNLVSDKMLSGIDRQMQYDASGKSTGVTFGDGGFFNVEYDLSGNVKKIISNDGYVIQRKFDGIGRMSRLILPDQSEANISYDFTSGNLKTLTDANGNTTLFEYDLIGRRISETYQDGSRTSYEYTGSLLSAYVNQSGEKTQYQYDGDARLIGIAGPDGQPSVQYEYNSLGSMIKAQTKTNITSFAYGADFHMISTTSNDRTISYSHSMDNQTHNVVYPSGKQLTRNYDARGRLLSISVDNQLVCTITWSESQPELIQLGNGIVGSYTYGADKVPESLKYELNGITLEHLEYLTKPIGFIDGVRNNINPELSETYERDVRGRLINFKKGQMDNEGVISSPSEIQQWQYDSMDNWEVFIDNDNTQNRQHDSVGRLIKVNDTDLIYDAVGNLIDDGSRSYAYDFQNNLISVTLQNGNVMTYQYDALGRRISKTIGGSVTEYVYDNNRLVEEYLDGQLHAFYVYSNYSNNPDDIIAANINGEWYFYLKNFQGSIIAIANASGKIVEKYKYQPYGGFTAFDGNNQIVSSLINTHLFAGMYYDVDCGLYYARSRYYNPNFGRFISPDPLSWVSSGGVVTNYVFADSDPIMYNDPFGKLPAPSKICSGHRIQFAVPNLGFFEKLFGKPKGEFLFEIKDCEKCCKSGIHEGLPVSERAVSMTANIKYSSNCVPVIIPGLPPLGWKTPTGACAGLFATAVFKAGGSAFIQQDKCNDSHKGGGCIGISIAGWLRGGYSGDMLDAWGGGSIGGNGKVCLVGNATDIHAKGQACLSGKLSARLQLKKITIWFIQKPYYEYTFWQGSWCTDDWEIL